MTEELEVLAIVAGRLERNLLAAVPDLDRDYLSRWTTRLDLNALYRAVAR